MITLSLFAPCCAAENVTLASDRAANLYDADSNHILNRLHRALFVRSRSNEDKKYGFDQLDPLLWSHTKHLLEGESHENAIKLMDELLAAGSDALPRDPVKRAILQRDLWAVFDWTASSYRDRQNPGRDEAKRQLQKRLASIIRRLALSREQIEALPDNYAAAIKSGAFAKEFDEKKPETPFLPPDLFSTNGSWVCVASAGSEPLASVHAQQFGGRSEFLVLMQTPDGRDATLAYLKQLSSFPQPWVYKVDPRVWISSNGEATSNRTHLVANTNLPVFADGTTFALVRRTLLIDDTGELVPTRLVENVQMRRYNDTQATPNIRSQAERVAAFTKAQNVFEFILSKQQLFQGASGGLRAVAHDEKDFRQFMSKGFDPFEMANAEFLKPALDCRTCHSGVGLSSVNSFLENFRRPSANLPVLADSQFLHSRDAALSTKKQKFNWGLLQGLWR